MADITLTGTGSYAAVEAQVDPTHRALRASLRPPEAGIYGSYRIALTSGAMAAGLAANAAIFSVRWGQTGAIMLLRRLGLTAFVAGTGFTAGQYLFSLYRAASFSALDTAGAAITFAGKDNVKASRFQASNLQTVGGIAIANTGALTAGTRTLDDNAFAAYSGQVGTGTQVKLIDTATPLYDARGEFAQPEEFWSNEGIVLRATVPATGVWGPFCVEMEWDEVDPGRYLGSFG